MTPEYIVVETRGTDTSIDWVNLVIRLEQNGRLVMHNHEEHLKASLPFDADDENIINETISSMGDATHQAILAHLEESLFRTTLETEHPVQHRKEDPGLLDTVIPNSSDLMTAITKVIKTADRVKNKHLESGVEVTISDGTFTVDTTRSSIDLLNGARVDAQARPDYWAANPKRWRMKDGTWVNLSAADVEIMSNAIADHVEACFSWFEQQENAAMQCTSVAQAQTLRETVLQGVS